MLCISSSWLSVINCHIMPSTRNSTTMPPVSVLWYPIKLISSAWPTQYALAYLIFFLIRNWFVCPHFFFLQFTARGCRRA